MVLILVATAAYANQQYQVDSQLEEKVKDHYSAVGSSELWKVPDCKPAGNLKIPNLSAGCLPHRIATWKLDLANEYIKDMKCQGDINTCFREVVSCMDNIHRVVKRLDELSPNLKNSQEFNRARTGEGVGEWRVYLSKQVDFDSLVQNCPLDDWAVDMFVIPADDLLESLPSYPTEPKHMSFWGLTVAYNGFIIGRSLGLR